jgi:hypothetical protein
MTDTDGYIRAIDAALARSAEVGRTRESGRHEVVELIDLPGVPMTAPVGPITVELLPEATAGEVWAAMRDGGVPVLDSPPDDKAIELMREAGREKDGDELIELDGVPLREAVYGAQSGHAVYYEGPELLPALKDLYTVLDESLATTGGPNLANEIVKNAVREVEAGHPLPPATLAKVKDLLAEHADAIAALRAKEGTARQDYMDVPDPAHGRDVTDDDRKAGLLDLGDAVPTVAA